MGITLTDEDWMRQAIALAQYAEQQGEVPVGAVLVKEGELIAEAWNCPLATHDPSAHAEIRALRLGGERLANYRLVETTLYVTLEPCLMCLGAIIHARVKRLVYGADDPNRGAVVSALSLNDMTFLNHRLDYKGGVLSGTCGHLLKSFFSHKRR